MKKQISNNFLSICLLAALLCTNCSGSINEGNQDSGQDANDDANIGEPGADADGDADYTQTIFDMSGLDYRANFQRQGQAWDSFVNEMWATYR